MRGEASVWGAIRSLMLTGLGLTLSVPAQAHHSFAMFDKQRKVTLQGIVHKIEWANPHVYIFLDVDERDSHKQYAVECGSPNMLSRLGWKVNTIKAGDKVTVTVYPLRDGRLGGLIDTVTLADGKVIEAV